MGHYKQEMDTKEDEEGTLDEITGDRNYFPIRTIYKSYDFFRRRLLESKTLKNKDMVLGMGTLEKDEKGRPLKCYVSFAFHEKSTGEIRDRIFAKFSDPEELKSVIENMIMTLCIFKRRQMGDDPLIIDKDIPLETLLADLFIKTKYILGSEKLIGLQEDWRNKKIKEMEAKE